MSKDLAKQASWSQAIKPVSPASQVICMLDFHIAWEAFSKALALGSPMLQAFSEVAPALVKTRSQRTSSLECLLDYDKPERLLAIERLADMAQSQPELARALAPRWDPDQQWWSEREGGDYDGEFLAVIIDLLCESGRADILERFAKARAFEGLWESADWARSLAWNHGGKREDVVDVALGASWSGPMNFSEDDWVSIARNDALFFKVAQLSDGAALESFTLAAALAVGKSVASWPEPAVLSVARSVQCAIDRGIFQMKDVSKALKTKAGKSTAAPVRAVLERWVLGANAAAPNKDPAKASRKAAL
jgi:hypothetical protein